MPHQRIRHAVPGVEKLASLWPVIGVIGARQVGKSTLIRDQLALKRQRSMYSLDEEDVLEEIEASAKVFIGRITPPALIDEAQKAPKLFDAIKARVDRKRIPGQFFLTGSAQFSARLGIRESLTGRIGLLHLHPLTLAELHEKSFQITSNSLQLKKPRFSIETFSQGIERGGLPFPCFLRDTTSVRLFWDGWLETTVHRDIARFFKRSYDPRVTQRILGALKQAAKNGEMLDTSSIQGIQSRRLQSYLSAMEDTFLLRRLSCHEAGTGRDLWQLFDSGLLSFLLGSDRGEGTVLSLVRTFLMNEISAQGEYSADRLPLTYFKSQKGNPIDLIWKNIPLKIITSSSLRSIGWEERALHGAMKKLGVARAALVAPVDRPQIESKGISILPWSYWS